LALPDLINASFEAGGSLFILNHCRVLWKTKQAHGISLLSTAFFASWGVWNIYYYPYLGQFFSFLGGIAIVLANALWVWMIWYIRRQQRLGNLTETLK